MWWKFTSAANHSRVAERLSGTDYDGDACRAALRGESVPSNLGNDVARFALVSGIRHHVDLARSAEVGELERFPGQEIFSRARNARRIMSNRFPPVEAMDHESLYPYCIWYPDVATEDTYQTLALSYPDMRYQIGRACAVAGYDQLYHRLNLLPDVSIAEEARENRANPGAHKIFLHIMAAPVRYRVMNDATRTIHLSNPRSPAFLNGDTAVVATLAAARRGYSASFHPDPHYPNITEDWNIAECGAPATEPPILTAATATLFYTPLPPDLPSLSKTLLTLHAAATGNVDRYARLRTRDLQPLTTRVHGVRFELVCLTRGAYHSSAMAAFLASSPRFLSKLALHERERVMLWRGIHARRVMDGVAGHLLVAPASASGGEGRDEEDDHEEGGDEEGEDGDDGDDNGFVPVPDAELPYWIWRPSHPPADVLRQLAEARPAMRSQCVRACIVAGYRAVYDAIMEMEPAVLPDKLMMAEAEAAGDEGRYYRNDLAQRAEQLGLKAEWLPVCEGYEHWMDAPSPWERERRLVCPPPRFLRDTEYELRNTGESEWDYGFFDGFDVTLESINCFLSKEEAYRREKLGLGKE